MTDRRLIVLMLVASLVAVAPRDVWRPDPGATVPALLQECLPPHLARRMKCVKIPEASRGAAADRIINESKCWPAGTVLKVCFLEGTNQETCSEDRQVRRRVGGPEEWHRVRLRAEGPGGQLPVFEGGDPSEIRITFRYGEIWSIVGQDSRKTIRGADHEPPGFRRRPSR